MSPANSEVAISAHGISKSFRAVRASRRLTERADGSRNRSDRGERRRQNNVVRRPLRITRPDAGRVTLSTDDGELDTTRLPPHSLARIGVQRTFQHLRLAMDLSVEQNLRLGCDEPSFRKEFARALRFGRGRNDRRETTDEVAATLGLDRISASIVKDLSYGERKLVSLGRALTAKPSVLLLDEPASGLDEASRMEMIAHIQRVVTEHRMTICVIEHSLLVVESLAEHLIFMEHGAVVADGPTAEVLRDERVSTSYFGARPAVRP